MQHKRCFGVDPLSWTPQRWILEALAPAAFATTAHERTSAKYTFIPTERVLTGLMQAGFVPVEARQAHARRARSAHARHILRLRRRFETVELKGSVPE